MQAAEDHPTEGLLAIGIFTTDTCAWR